MYIMGKLNVEIPVVNVKVGGVEYHKVDRKAQAGDIVKTLVSGIDITEGAFYRVEADSDGDLFFRDNEGSRRFRLTGGHIGNHEVYEKVAEKPTRLTVGDYAKVIGPNNNGHNYDADSVIKIVFDDRTGYPYKGERANGAVGNWLSAKSLIRATEADFLAQKQPEPTAQPDAIVVAEDAIIVHEGRSYRKVSRKASVGDLVVITGTEGHKHFALGSVFTIKNEQGTGTNGIKYGVGQAYVAWECDITVLEPLATVTEVKRHARVGERIRIVNAEDTRYGNGAEFVVSEDGGGGDVFVKHPEGAHNGQACVGRSEYVVLETVEAAPIQARIPVGSTVRILTDTEDLAKGAIAKMTRDDGEGDKWPYRCELLDGSNYDYFRADQIEVVSAEESAKITEEAAVVAKWAAIGRKVDEYKAGDLVRFTESTGASDYGNGSLAVIANVNGSDFSFGGSNGGKYLGDTKWCVLVTPVEQRFDKR